jgi:hypothetical protein
MNSFHNLHRRNSCSYLCCLAEDWLLLFPLWCGLVPVLVLFFNQPTSQPVSLGQRHVQSASWSSYGAVVGVCGGTVAWGIVPQRGRLWVQFLLVLTQPLIEMSTKDVSWGQRRPVHSVDNLATFVCWLFRNSGSLNLLVHKGPPQACRGKALPLPYGGVVGDSNVLDVLLCCQVSLTQRQNTTSQKTEIKLMAVANHLCEILCWNVNGCVINLVWRLNMRT